MSSTGLAPDARWRRIRRFRNAAKRSAAQHPTAMASLCAFALLGAPLVGVMVATLFALRHSRVAFGGAVHRLRALEREVTRLNHEADKQKERVRTSRIDAAKQMADRVAHERERTAELTRRAIHEPMRRCSIFWVSPMPCRH
jgi:hypothetical protein